MGIKINRQRRSTLFILLMLASCMMLTVSRMIILGSVLLCAVGIRYNTNTRNLQYHQLVKRMKLYSGVQTVLLLLLLVFQFFVVRLSVSQLGVAVVVEIAIFSAPILVLLLVRSFNNLKVYLNAFKIFSTIFSLYYLLMLLINGMPEGRDSVLGIVSSNFCASVLYLPLPLFLYYLISPNIPKTKKDRNSILRAMFLSLLVILTTGSRTALGALVIIALFLFMYSLMNKKARRWFFRGLLVVLIIGIVMFFTMPQVRKLLERAISMFTEEGGVSNDVRSSLVWVRAMDMIRNSNIIIGSGTNIIADLYEMAAHNIWLEIMMTSGIYGLVLWLIMMISALWLMLRTHDRAKRYFGGMVIALYLFVGMLQPFLSTGYMCGVQIWLSFYTIMLANRT